MEIPFNVTLAASIVSVCWQLLKVERLNVWHKFGTKVIDCKSAAKSLFTFTLCLRIDLKLNLCKLVSVSNCVSIIVGSNV